MVFASVILITLPEDSRTPEKKKSDCKGYVQEKWAERCASGRDRLEDGVSGPKAAGPPGESAGLFTR